MFAPRTASLLGLLLLPLAACTGSDVGTSAAVPRAGEVVADGGSVTPPTGPICTSHDDCAPLASAACVVARCDAASGRCIAAPAPDFSACDDGEPCSAESLCLAGGCVASRATVCDDGNPCTTDTCAAGVGCVGKPVTLVPCSDDNPCTVDDHCEEGACVASENLCGCQQDQDCDAVGNKCASELRCVGGGCVPAPGAVPNCDDNQPCTLDTCDPKSGCAHQPRPDGTPCDDGDLCTAAERCLIGACVSAAKLPCGDGGPCVAAGCDAAKGCFAEAETDGAACDDGSPCSEASSCQGGACVGVSSCECAIAADCEGSGALPACLGAWACRLGRCEVDPTAAAPCAQPDEPCRVARCEAVGCVVENLGQSAACSDGNACTVGDACDASGNCSPGTTLACDDGIDCTSDACVPSSGCLHGPSSLSLPCDDGNGCTTEDRCEGLICRGTASGCDDGDPCTTDFCHPLIAKCAHSKLAEGATCDDGDACTLGDRCTDGLCAAKTVQICDDGDPCTTESCDGVGGCTTGSAAAGTACDDNDPCTEGDTCSEGTCDSGNNTCACTSAADCAASEDGDLCNGTLICVKNVCVVDPGTIVTCADPGQACLTVSCNGKTGLCVQSPAPKESACDDGDACTTGERCLAGGLCKGGVPIDCDDGDPCNLDGCEPGSGCVHAPLPAGVDVPCDDGDPCTFGDLCGVGGCVSGASACQCKVDADCAAFEDDTLCTAPLTCQAGSCKPSAPPVVCDPSLGSPCVDHLCQPDTGTCALIPRLDGAPCIEGTGAGCLGNGVCQTGQCLTGDGAACDDGDACTKDLCTADGTCSHPAAPGVPCDDNEPCTEGETCAADGSCKGGSSVCECQSDAECPDDGDLCNGVPFCLSNSCVAKPGTVVSCDQSGDGPCKTTSCEPKTGTCAAILASDGAACDDGDACTLQSACKGGSCAGSGTPSCDDGEPCTADGCNPASGCFHTNLTTPCDDGDPCTTGDVCQAGSCQSGSGTCACKVDGDCPDDGNACNGVPICQQGQCVVTPESVVSCDPSQDGDCAKNLCDPVTGICKLEPFPAGTACDDGNVCTSKDGCQDGACSGTPFSCDDGNPCSDDACDPKSGCSNTPNAAPCDDGKACTAPDVCSGGACVGGPDVCAECKVDADCPDDGNACTTIACVAGTCAPGTPPAGTPCDDGDACTSQSLCAAGQCQGSGSVDCDDGDACTIDGCVAASGCTHTVQLGAPCDDGNACTQGDSCAAAGCQSGPNVCECAVDADCASKQADLCDGALVCQAGFCVAGPAGPVVCDGSGDTACAQAQCNPVTGACQVVPVPDGAPCDDGSACTAFDVCEGGSCTPGNDVCTGCKTDDDCPDDGDLCNGLPTCKAGQCEATPVEVVCPPADGPCSKSACEPATGACVTSALPDGGACPDDSACTVNELCLAGQCVAAKLDCDDDNPCTTDACDAIVGCTHAPTTGISTCDDGDPCTPFSICQGGKCNGPINTCFCQSDADCPDDNDACNGVRVCAGGQCQVEPGSVVSCPPSGEACKVSSCLATTGACVLNPAPAGTACDDANSCTVGDLCTAGSCVGAPLGCNDGQDCTKDACEPGKGCVSTPNDAACDDGNACSKDACDPSMGCVYGSAVGVPCDDGDLCTDAELCQDSPEGALCGGGVPKVCDDGNACTTDACSAFVGCTNTPLAEGAACDDGDPCTPKDVCTAGSCAGSGGCDDGNACTVDVCDKDAGCQNVNSTDPCDDGDPCTSGETCNAGACVSGPKNPLCCAKDADCDDGDGCSQDSCKDGGCVRAATPCTADSNVCTLDRCLAGVCAAVNPAAELIVLFEENFDDGVANGVYTTHTNDKVAWQLSKQRSASGDVSFYFGNSDTLNYDYGISSGDILLRPITIPATGEATLSGRVWMDVSNNGCAADKIQLFINGALQSGQICASSAVFALRTWSLAAFAGQTVEIAIRFDSVDAANNTTEGAYIDDIAVSWKPGPTTACEDGDACTTGEVCQADATCGGGSAVVCDDGSDCTTDSCDPATGSCVFEPKTGYFNDFSQGLGGITVQSSNQNVTWQADGKRTASPPTAAYLGNINLFGLYSYNFGLTVASMQLPQTAIPASASKAWVRAKVYFDSGETGGCTGISDRVAITVGGQIGAQQCGDTNGFVTLEADATAAIGGNVTSTITFFANPIQNNGEGVWIDDVEIGWSCAP